MLRAPAAETPLDQIMLLGIMSWIPATIAGHPRSSVGVLASTHVVVKVMVFRRPLVRFLRVEVFSLISLPLNSTLLIEVIVSILHRPLYIHCGIVQVHVGGVMMHRHPFLDVGIELGLEPVHLEPLIGYEGRAKSKSSINLVAYSRTLIPPHYSSLNSFSFFFWRDTG